MNAIQYINACCAVKRISQATVARALGQTPQNFNKKMIKETILADELFQIADHLGASVEFISNTTGEPFHYSKDLMSNTVRANDLFQVINALGASVRFVDNATGEPIV